VDHEQFDGLVRALGSGATRRGALGLLAGVAGLGLGGVEAKRQGKKQRGKGRVRAQEANPNKRDICHFDAETGTYHLINIDDSAVQKHLDNHGDFFPAAENGCCTDADCGDNEACVVDEETRTGSCEAIGCSPVGTTCCGEPGCGPTACDDNPACSCGATVDGTTACFQWNVAGAGGPCSLEAPCPAGEACIAATCAGDICQPLCADSGIGFRSAASSRGPNTE
jgi:hypothetical protein